MTSATSAAASSAAAGATPAPGSTTFTGPPICCAAAIASHDARLSVPSRLFGDDENHQITLASSRSTRTSSFAASAGEPPIMRVCFDFSGR